MNYKTVMRLKDAGFSQTADPWSGSIYAPGVGCIHLFEKDRVDRNGGYPANFAKVPSLSELVMACKSYSSKNYFILQHIDGLSLCKVKKGEKVIGNMVGESLSEVVANTWLELVKDV